MAMRRVGAIVLDLVLVLAFAAIGRASHASALDVEGLTRTAFPFLAAALLAWVALVLRRSQGTSVRNGVFVWAVTLVAGLVFRLMIGDTAQVAFIVVAALTLAVFLIGWRAIRALIVRRRRPVDGPRRAEPRRSGNPARRASAQG